MRFANSLVALGVVLLVTGNGCGHKTDGPTGKKGPGTTSAGPAEAAGTAAGEVNETGFAPAARLEPGPGGVLYGVASKGGRHGSGVVFKLNEDGSGFKVLKHLAWSEGATPLAGLTLSENILYGTASVGGRSGAGTAFKATADGSGFSVLKHFGGEAGEKPQGELTLDGRTLYGTTVNGGKSGKGVVYKMNTDGSGFMVLHHFGPGDGEYPFAGLNLSGNTLYGSTYGGGSNRAGTIYRLETDGSGYAIILHCGWLNGANPMMPHHRMVLSGNTLYGTAPGGSHGGGLVFKIGTDGSGFTVLKQLGVPLADAGAFPGPLTLAENNVYGALEHGGRTGRTSWEGAFFKVGTDGSGFGFIKRLTRAEGAKTTAAPVFVSGALYGVAPQGGGGNKGTLFRLSADGAEFAVLKEFGADEPN